MNENFKILLEAMIDQSSLSNVQKQVAKERLKMNVDISVENFAKSKAEMQKQIASLATYTKNIMGGAITDKEANKWATQFYKEMISGAKQATKEQGNLVNSMAKVREKTELARQAEERRQASAKTNAINKNLEQEYALVRKINDVKSSGKLTTDFSKLGADYNNLANKTTALKTAFQGLQVAKYNFENSGNNKDLISNYQKYNSSLQSVRNQVKQLTIENQKLNQSDAFSRMKSNSLNKIDTFLKTNTALTEKSKNQFLQLRSAIEAAGNVKSLRNLNGELTNLQRTVKAAGETGRSFGDEMKNNFRKFSQWVGASTIFFGMTRAIKGVVDDVKELDTEMTSLKKVTEATDAQFENFLVQATTNAKLLGASITEIVKSASEFSRLGYNLPDATELSRVANLYKNVGDGISIDDATSSIISTMKAFNIQASDAESIIDKFNKVGNEYSISSAGIGEALMRSASALKEANNDLSQSIALQVGANNVIQDPDVVGTMWKTVAMRIRGAKTELEDAGLETDGMVESTSKLRDTIQGITGFDILMPDNQTFKSTYDIIVGIGEEYSKLSDLNQASLLELLAGKRQGNALAAALNNLEDIKNSYQAAEDSAGSAAEEQEKYTKSIQYSLDVLSASAEEFSNTFLSSSFVKGVVDGLNLIVGGLTDVTKLLGTIPTLATIAFGVMGAKGHGKQLCFKHTPMCPVYI